MRQAQTFVRLVLGTLFFRLIFGQLGESASVEMSEMEPHHQFSIEAAVYTEAGRGQISFKIQYGDLAEKLRLAESTAKQIMAMKSTRSSIEEILPGFETVSAELDDLVNFFALEERAQVKAHRLHPELLARHVDLDGVWQEGQHQGLHNTSPPHKQMHNFMDTISGWRDVLQTQHSAVGGPSPRALMSIVSGVLSGVALDKSKSVEAKVESMYASIDLVAEHVDVLADSQRESGETIANIIKQQQVQNSLLEENKLNHYWQRTTMAVHAAANIAHTATTGKLSPDIRLLTDVPKIFKKFSQRVERDGYVMPFNSSVFLHRLPAVFQGNQFQFSVLVSIPLTRTSANRWTLLKHLPRPLVYEDQVIEVNDPSGQTFIVRDMKSGSTIELEHDALQGCAHLPGEFYCGMGPTIIEQKPPHTCLTAILAGQISAMTSLCEIRIRNITEAVWALGPNTFVWVAREPFTAILKCKHNPPVSVRLTKRMTRVKIPSSCSLATPTVSVSAADDTVMVRMEVTIPLASITGHIKNITGLGLQEIPLPRPFHLKDIAQEVRRMRLRAEEKGWLSFPVNHITLVISVLAILALMGSLAYLWCRVRAFNMSPLSFMEELVHRAGAEGNAAADEHQQPPPIRLEVAAAPPSLPSGSHQVAVLHITGASAQGDCEEGALRRRPLFRDLVGGYEDCEDSDSDLELMVWKRGHRQHRKRDRVKSPAMIHTPVVSLSSEEDEVREVTPQRSKPDYITISDDDELPTLAKSLMIDSEDDCLLLKDSRLIEEFYRSASPPRTEPPTPCGSRTDRLAVPVTPSSLTIGERFHGFVNGWTANFIIDDTAPFSRMSYDFALQIGGKAPLDLCQPSLGMSAMDNHGTAAARIWITVAMTQLHITALLCTQRVEIVLGAEDYRLLQANLHQTADPLLSSTSDPELPEPMQVDIMEADIGPDFPSLKDDDIVELLQDDALAADRLNTAAQFLLEADARMETEEENNIIIPRISIPPAPVHLEAEAGGKSTQMIESHLDIERVRSVVVVPPRKWKARGKRAGKKRNKRLKDAIKTSKNSLKRSYVRNPRIRI